jgi:hypothetical protein
MILTSGFSVEALLASREGGKRQVDEVSTMAISLYAHTGSKKNPFDADHPVWAT